MNERSAKNWVEKLDGTNLNAIESAELDELLNVPAQAGISRVVKALPQESPSLQWRSSLNEKLRALAPVRKQISMLVVGFRALAGIGLASLVGIALYAKFAPQPSVARADPQTVASALISEHRESVASSEIAGPGVVDSEVEKKTVDDQTDLDSESL